MVRTRTPPISAMALFPVSRKPLPEVPVRPMTLKAPLAPSVTSPSVMSTRLRAMPFAPEPGSTMPLLMTIVPARGVAPSRLPRSRVWVPSVPAAVPIVLIVFSIAWVRFSPPPRPPRESGDPLVRGAMATRPSGALIRMPFAAAPGWVSRVSVRSRIWPGVTVPRTLPETADSEPAVTMVPRTGLPKVEPMR